MFEGVSLVDFANTLKVYLLQVWDIKISCCGGKGNYVVVINLKDKANAKFVTAYVANDSVDKIRYNPIWKIKKRR